MQPSSKRLHVAVRLLAALSFSTVGIACVTQAHQRHAPTSVAPAPTPDATPRTAEPQPKAEPAWASGSKTMASPIIVTPTMSARLVQHPAFLSDSKSSAAPLLTPGNILTVDEAPTPESSVPMPQSRIPANPPPNAQP